MMIDLIRNGSITRFSWVSGDIARRDVSVAEFDGTQRCILIESLRRDVARHRWLQLRRAGWRKLNEGPIGVE